MINTKQSHKQKQSLQWKCQRNEMRNYKGRETFDTDRRKSEPGSAGRRCRLWKATGYSVSSAECGTMKCAAAGRK
jgi:hypothetical protein